MNPENRPRGLRNSDFVIYSVVGISYLATIASYDRSISTWEWVILGLLGALFTAMAVVGPEWVETRGAVVTWLYFLAQTCIGGVIFYLSDGGAALVLLPVSSQTTFFFGRRGVLIANALIQAVASGVIWELTGNDLTSTVNSSLFILASIVFVVVFSQITASEQRMRAEVERLASELGQANRKLSEYAVNAEALATVQERNRLAREIHDGLGHYLTAVNMQIKAAQAVMAQNPQQAQDSLGKAQQMAQEALAEVRRSVAALRADPALSQPLRELIAGLLDECRAAGLVAELQMVGEARRLPIEVTQTLYRAAQETLTNVRKHAFASRVDVLLEFQPHAARLRVQDNGVGAQSVAAIENGVGFGLLGLRERVQLLGGRLEVKTAPGEGFTIEILLPVVPGISENL